MLFEAIIFEISTKSIFSVDGQVLIRLFPFTPSFVGVNTWPLFAVLMAASTNLYFAASCQQDTELTEV